MEGYEPYNSHLLQDLEFLTQSQDRLLVSSDRLLGIICLQREDAIYFKQVKKIS